MAEEFQGIVEKILDPHKEILAKIIRRAWEYCEETFAEHKAWFLGPTLANILRSRMVLEATQLLPLRGFSIYRKGQMILFEIKEFGYAVRLRFKKLNDQLLSSNVTTKQSDEFSEGYQFSLFDDLIARVNLNAGYRLNPTQTDIDIFLVCPDGSRMYRWTINLEESEPSQAIIAVENTHKLPTIHAKDPGLSKEQKAGNG